MTSWLIQYVLDPAGPQAALIESHWWEMFWVCTAVFVLVIVATALAVARGRSAHGDRPSERSLRTGVAAATASTVLILFGLLVSGVVTGRALARLSSENALVVEVVGYQWWWQITYTDPQPSLRVTTANELHLPTGRPIALLFKSGDVIHSFWVPNLHGKMDLIPGRQTSLLLRVDREGQYRGQCAEFCGAQHAHMALPVTAESPDAFDRWMAAQRAEAAPPSGADAQRGRELFERTSCVMCHTIRGGQAAARLGPDLTHFATRGTIAAGTIPNTVDNLTRWIADPHGIKAGVRMPSTPLSTEDLRALVTYLRTLK
jgi:cytochrome c oxidase subunit II